jgi:hypothetical protein
MVAKMQGSERITEKITLGWSFSGRKRMRQADIQGGAWQVEGRSS